MLLQYFSYQTGWKEYFADNKIIYDSPTVEQFLNFSTKRLKQGVPHSVLVPAKSAVTHALRMKNEHIHQLASVLKYSRRTFKLRLSLQKLSFVWDVKLCLNI